MGIWKLDDIDFDVYGVRVMRARGVLDMPRLQNEGHEWLDENYRDWWQQADQLKYHDREIILECYISARPDSLASKTAFEVFNEKLATFYQALMSEGKRTLATPYGEISDVSLQAGLNITNKQRYISKLQVGLFQLRLTVHGDSQYNNLTIVHSSGAYTVATVKYNNLAVNKRLQGECYASVTAEVNQKLTVSRFDKINLNYRGPGAEWFYLDKEPEVRKLSTNKYVYNFRFEHESSKMKDVAFMLEGEADFYLFANLEEIIDLIIVNADRVFTLSTMYVRGDIPATIRKNHKFTGENCYQVLQRIVAEYELEWEFVYQSLYGFFYINVAKRIGREWPLSIEYGKGKGMYEITRDGVSSDELVTQLFSFGAAKNLKPSYGSQRLRCPGNPLTANVHLYGVKEATKFFDDIYPRRTGVVTAYTQILKVEEGDPGYAAYAAIKEEWPGGMYRVEDTSLDFDLNDYLLGGPYAKIRMTTGDLAGFEFEIARYDHQYAYMFLLPFKDERGELFPNAVLQINEDDQYVLVDIDQPVDYVEDAEAELLAAALDYLDEYSIPKVTYRAVIDPAYLASLSGEYSDYKGFNVGDKVTIIDVDLGISAQFRIAELTKHFYTGRFELLFSENRVITPREVVNQRLNRIERSIQDTEKDQVESMKKDDMTTGELYNILLDPALEKLRVENIVRKESIDPIHLGFDSGMPQVSIENGFFEANFGGDYDKINVDAGKIVMHNFNALPRYEIGKLRSASLEYNPTREWSFDAQELTVPDSDGHWIYAKLPLAAESNTCTFIFSKMHVEIKKDLIPGYLTYKIGYVTSTASPRHLGMLWGNVKLNSTIKEIADEAAGELDLRTGWNPDALEKVRVRTVLLSKAFDVLAVSGYSTLEYWHLGSKVVTMGAYTVDLGATYETVPQGKHYIYFDSTGIHATQTPWNLARKDIVFTGVVYWNGGSLYTGWHCHAWNYPADLRAAARPAITSGLAITINATESHKIDVADGILKFADIEAPIRGNVTGHETFKQQLRALEARRLWKAGGLWYDDLESELVAKLDGTNNVQYCDPATGLQSLVDGEYTAVWVVGTYCNHRPVKIVLGSFKGSTAEEAKTLNTPQSFIDIAFDDCAEVNHVISRVIIKDIAIAPYYEIVEIDDTIRDDFEETPTFEQVQADWNEVDTDDPGYIRNKPAIPDAQIQSDWSQADSGAVDYIKNKPTIPNNTDEKVKYDASDPSAGYLADKIIAGTNVTINEGSGADENKLVISASGGGGGDTFLVHLKFEAVGSIVYTAPYACKFTAMKYSQTNAPTLSVALDTIIAEYGDLTVTADATGLVTLTGIWL